MSGRRDAPGRPSAAEDPPLLAGPVRIAHRFHGPPDSGNGGYVCGLLAARHPGPVSVRLHAPPPLERELQLSTRGEGTELWDGETLVASARPAEVEIEVPACPDAEQTAAAAAAGVHLDREVFPSCFVCGPRREPGDGLRIFPGPVQDRPLLAAPWTPHASLAGPDGGLAPEFLWAALDCPGGFAVMRPGETIVLGECAARIDARPLLGEACRVIGWSLGPAQGRRRFAGSAVFDSAGSLCAVARATWVALAEA